MKYPDNIQEVAKLGPDYLGFIFYDQSPRSFTRGKLPAIDTGIKKTGVFVNASPGYIEENIIRYQLNTIQLHGEETPSYCASLKTQHLEIIKAFSIKDDFDFNVLRDYEERVDLFLFDTHGETKGGTGRTFNWELLQNYHAKIPFFLSGGIGIEEIQKVGLFYQQLKNEGKGNLLYGLDINSRFESKPGQKIIANLEQFQKDFALFD